MKTEIIQQLMELIQDPVFICNADGDILYLNPLGKTLVSNATQQKTTPLNIKYLHKTNPVAESFNETAPWTDESYDTENGVRYTVKQLQLLKNNTDAHYIYIFECLDLIKCSSCKVSQSSRLQNQLQAFIEASFDGIWFLDSKGTVLNINKASEELHNLKRKDVIGKNIEELEKSNVIEQAITPVVLRTKKRISRFTTIQGKPVLATGSPVFDDNNVITSVVINERDISDLNSLRAELENTQLEAEKAKEKLLELLQNGNMHDFVVPEDKSMLKIIETTLRLAKMNASGILLLGDSGAGKGQVVKFFHHNSERSQHQLIQINCAALPENLLEAELFGYERGAFTGAREQGKPGLIELAHNGTLFLDEIGDLPLSLQAKLLKYLDDNTVRRIGGVKVRAISCSVLSATNTDLNDLVEKGLFRKDLFYRLNTFTINIPPLRERSADILLLANHFLTVFNKEFKQKKRLSSYALKVLQQYEFPGNIRELKNIIRKAVILSTDLYLDEIIVETINENRATPIQERQFSTFVPVDDTDKTLKEQVAEFESYILQQNIALHKSSRQIAKKLGVNHSTILRKIQRYNLKSAPSEES